MIHVLLDVMYTRAPYTVIQRAMNIHPTVAEYLPVILGKLQPFVEKGPYTWQPAFRQLTSNLSHG